jgi:acetyl/propionyl-CoA carboxylase alpha subunit
VSGIRVEWGALSRSVRAEPSAAELDGRRVAVAMRELDAILRELTVDGVRHRVAWVREGDRVFLWCDGRSFVFSRAKAARAGAGAEAGGDLRSPMPGRVRRSFAREGDSVGRGQVLLVLEAMKMEHAIRAPRDGVVRAVHVREGDLVEAGVELAEIE